MTSVKITLDHIPKIKIIHASISSDLIVMTATLIKENSVMFITASIFGNISLQCLPSQRGICIQLKQNIVVEIR